MNICPVCLSCFEGNSVCCSPEVQQSAEAIVSRFDSRFFSKYSLDKLITAETTGEIFEATHINLNQSCIVRFINAEIIGDGLEKLTNEVKSACEIIHRHLVGILDYGTLENGDFFVVSEMFQGRTLRQFMDDSAPLTEEIAVNIARQAAHGLEAAHQAGLCHRLVNPTNIIVGVDANQQPLVKINNFDFGGFRQQFAAGETDFDALKYISSKQLQKDSASDCYGLAVVLCEMLGGELSLAAVSDLRFRQTNEKTKTVSRRTLKIERMLNEFLPLALRDDSAATKPAAAFLEALNNLEQFIIRQELLPLLFEPRVENNEIVDEVVVRENNLSQSEVENTRIEKQLVAVPFTLESIVTQANNVAEIQNKRVSFAPRERRARQFSNPYLVAACLIFFGWLTVTGGIWSHPGRGQQQRLVRETQAAAFPLEEMLAVVGDVVTEIPHLVDVQSSAPHDWRTELNAKLDDWIAATNERDVEKQMEYYAPTVESFYLARNASQNQVRQEKKRVFDRATIVKMQTDKPDIVLSSDGEHARMRFEKEFVIAGNRGKREGKVLQELEWIKSGADWKIVGERDLKVISR